MPTIELTRMQAKAKTYDPETRTFEAVAATSTPVRRRDERGEFLEVLDMATLANVNALEGLPVLDSHSSGSVRDTVGTVIGGRIEDGALILSVRLSGASDVEPIAQRIADGTLKSVPVGYSVTGWTENRQRGKRILTPKNWAVRELSIVSTPADSAATIRSSGMPETLAPETGQITDDEKTRRSEIRTLCRSANFTDEQADEFIDSDATVDDVKVAIFDAGKAITRAAPAQVRTHAPANDDPATITRRQSDALHYRMNGGQLSEEAKPFVEMSLMDMARSSLERSGTSTATLSRDEVLARSAHTTSDFALTVSNAVGKTAMDSYRAAESPLKTLCRKTTLRDFKTSTAIKLGEMGRLEEMAENGEFTATTRGETGESIALKTYGRRMDLSRNLIINDDLNLLADTTRAFGEAAAQTEADLLVAQIVDNPAMADGTPVFDVSRGNIAATPGLPSKATLTESREAMRLRTGLDGKTLIDAKPAYMLVPADLETEAEEILASIQPNTVDDVNVFSGKLKLLVEPRLPSGTWYLFTDPARLASLRYAHMAGAEGVQIQRRDAWDVLRLSFRAYLDFGAGWLESRGVHQVETS
jgi:phage major head subunit gpT-like protein